MEPATCSWPLAIIIISNAINIPNRSAGATFPHHIPNKIKVQLTLEYYSQLNCPLTNITVLNMDAVMTVNKVRVEEKMKKKEGAAEKGLEAKKEVTAGDMKDTQEAD